FRAEQQAHRSTSRSELEKDLRQALSKGELELYYQPIVDVQQRAVTSFEALMRWHHPQRGTLAPAEFIGIAEETGLIGEMGEWALRQACKDAVAWPEPIKVTVNLSPLQFVRDDLHRIVRKALEDAGLAPQRLELEITETVLLRDEAVVHDALERLRELGVQIALDDFGTAYASLSYLRSFPFDKIKIDRSFVRDLDGPQHSDCVAIIHAVAALAKQLQMTTVAEGVETLDHLNTVTKAGCDVQGFYFSEPVPAGQIEGVLARVPGQVAKADARTAARSKQRRRCEKPATLLDRSAIHLLHKASQFTGEVFEREMGDGGLTPRQYTILAAVGETEGLNQTTLVHVTGIDRSTLAEVAHRMERKGLLRCRRGPKDRRANALSLTEKGREMLRSAEPAVKRVDKRMLRELPARHREQLLRDLALLSRTSTDSGA
ncbi:MAG: EAL domain-containing protein, partial [Terriglobia bacterium]